MEVSDRLCPLYIVSEYIYPTVFSKPKSSFSKSLENASPTILLKIDAIHIHIEVKISSFLCFLLFRYPQFL